MRCLVYGHRPIETAASPDVDKCRAANMPTLMPGQPVVICRECGNELHVGTMDGYLDALDRQPETMH